MPAGTLRFQARYDRGLSDVAAIGLIALSTDIVTEFELARMLPRQGVTISATRIRTDNPMTVGNLRAHGDHIAGAASLFEPEGVVGVFMYACTSGSAIISQSVLETKLRRSVPCARLTSPMTGALEGFKALGLRRVAMLAPYPDDVTNAVTRCIDGDALEVVRSGSFHIANDYDVIRVDPRSIVEAACQVDVPQADALFLPCTGFRAASIIAELESRLAKPVVAAHQAMLWHALRLAGYRHPVEGFGRLWTL